MSVCLSVCLLVCYKSVDLASSYNQKFAMLLYKQVFPFVCLCAKRRKLKGHMASETRLTEIEKRRRDIWRKQGAFDASSQLLCKLLWPSDCPYGCTAVSVIFCTTNLPDVSMELLIERLQTLPGILHFLEKNICFVNPC